MSRTPSARPLLAGAALLALLAALPAAGRQDTTRQDSTKRDAPKEMTSKGQVKVGVHLQKLQAGKLYQVRVEGAGFRPNVTIRPGYFTNMTSLDEGDTFQGYFVPQETREYRLFVLPSLSDDTDGGTLDYKVIFKPVPLGKKAVFQEKAELKASDPPYKGEDGARTEGPHKAFKVRLRARHWPFGLDYGGFQERGRLGY